MVSAPRCAGVATSSKTRLWSSLVAILLAILPREVRDGFGCSAAFRDIFSTIVSSSCLASLNGVYRIWWSYLGVYSNKSRTSHELGELLALVPDGPPPPSSRQPRLRRRPEATNDEIAAAYSRGATVNELAKRYHVNRRTVSAIVTRAGFSLCYRLIGPVELAQATALYESGQSLAMVAEQLGVAPNAVRAALIKVGVEMRGTHGRIRPWAASSGSKNLPDTIVICI